MQGKGYKLRENKGKFASLPADQCATFHEGQQGDSKGLRGDAGVTQTLLDAKTLLSLELAGSIFSIILWHG